MRWSSQGIDAEAERRLPGYTDAVVRRFNAPEALNTRFHEVHAKSALNHIPPAAHVPFEWTVNPYRGCSHACTYCFARPTHEYLDMNAGRDFEREIVVKVNVPEVLRAELARPSWGRHHVALGTNTDPYQWVEGRYGLMRGIWEAMRDAANPCSILTKSPLVLRDADLLEQIADRTHVSACLSVPTLDEKTWRATEPHTPHPRARLEAVAELNRRGIPTGILIAPLMPGINDSPEQVERIVALATEAGAVHIGGNTLFLRGSVRQIFFDWLRAHRPDLLERYERLYARGAYVPADERRTIEVSAGAPWARRTYPERFRHRSGGRRRGAAPGDRDGGTGDGASRGGGATSRIPRPGAGRPAPAEVGQATGPRRAPGAPDRGRPAPAGMRQATGPGRAPASPDRAHAAREGIAPGQGSLF